MAMVVPKFPALRRAHEEGDAAGDGGNERSLAALRSLVRGSRRCAGGRARKGKPMKNAPQRTLKHVWMVEEAQTSPGTPARSFWTKIGIAFENEDGSLTLTLAAIPVTGEMIIRDATPAAAPVKTRGAA